jgi:hypothetical protein
LRPCKNKSTTNPTTTKTGAQAHLLARGIKSDLHFTPEKDQRR